MDYVKTIDQRLGVINMYARRIKDLPQRQEHIKRAFNEFLRASDHRVKIKAFKIVCDATNNPPAVVEDEKVYTDVFLQMEDDPAGIEHHLWFA